MNHKPIKCDVCRGRKLVPVPDLSHWWNPRYGRKPANYPETPTIQVSLAPCRTCRGTGILKEKV